MFDVSFKQATFAQTQLWLLQQLDSTKSVYNHLFTLQVCGQLHYEYFEQSVQYVLNHYDIFKSSFELKERILYTKVVPHTQAQVNFVDLQAVAAQQQATTAVTEWAAQPFDLSQAPLLRICVFQTAPDLFILAVVVHEIIFAHGAEYCFWHAVFDIYTQLAQQVSLHHLRLSINSFTQTDAAVTEQPFTDSTPFSINTIPPLLLYTDSPPSAFSAQHSFTYVQTLDSDSCAVLFAFVQKYQVSLLEIGLFAYALVLQRWSGQNYFALATKTAPPPALAPEALALVYAVALQLNPYATLHELLEQIYHGCSAHMYVALEHDLQGIQPNQDYSARFRVSFNTQPKPAIQINDLQVLVAPLKNLTLQQAPVNMNLLAGDLAVTLVHDAEAIELHWEYRRDLWQEATISRMADYWLQAVQALATTPDLPITRLALLTPADHAVLATLAPTLPPASPLLLPERFRAQAARTPHAPALRHPASATTLTYADLLKQAEHLAAHLLAHGLTPDRPVAVLLPRSPDLVVALLAVLLAGGCYLPLDPAYPAERLRFMLADTQAPLVLIAEETRPLLPPHTGRTLDVQRLLATPAASASPSPAIHPQQLAYLIYTSGSTGTPKGVAITHANAAAFLAWASATFTPADLHVTLATTSVCFDLSIFELFAPLCGGGSVLLLPDALALPTVDTALAPTLLNTVPSVLAALLPLAPLPPSLRVIALAGEALPVPLATELLTHTTAQLYNLYGPSEDTTYSTWACFTHADALASAASVPIGQPISATQAFMLDPTGQQVPVGVVGELYLGGAGLARGYLGRPALTAERFVPHPWSSTPGARVYRTGDLVRLRPDGQIEYVGRRDNQIKLRGFRIELGEVQAVLEQAPGVAQAAVLVHADTPATAQLVGYVVPHTLDLSEATLRSWLDQQLPAYMVPSVLLLLPAFPRTPNGKLDRAALPAPNAMLPASTAAAPPATPTEELVAATWSIVLGQPITDRQANFFAYGGHSLLATRAIAQLQATLNRSIPVRLMFEASTLTAFAARLDALTAPTETSLLSPLVAAPRPQHLPLSFAQQGMWFLEQIAPGSAAYHIPMAWQINGSLDIAVLHKSFEYIIQQNEILRTKYSFIDSQLQQIIEPTNICFAVADVSHMSPLSSKDIFDDLLSAFINTPFDLQHDLPIRSILIKVEENVYISVTVIHHIAFDGWSEPLFWQKLNELYTSLLVDQQTAPTTSVLQYADYVLWQRKALTPVLLDSQLAFWRTQLVDCPPLLLPTDYPRPAQASHHGATYTVTLDATTTAMLNATAQQQQATLFMVVLTALALVLHRWTAQSHFAIGTPVANRTRPELEPLIGLFVNTLALPVTITSIDTLADLLASLRNTTLDAYAHQDVPFEHVVEAVQPVRDPSRSPVFQVMCVLEIEAPTFDLPHTQTTRYPVAVSSSKFDITLSVRLNDHTLEVFWEYRRDLWQEATISRMADYWLQAVQALATTPDLPITRLALLTPADHAALATLAPTLPPISPLLLPERFRAQAARTPHAPALHHPASATTLTYADLLEQAEHLAAHLLAHGLTPDRPVAVLLPRSPDLVVALLAILLAGGCYLPLDPAYPAERLRFMLADTQAPLVLIAEKTRPLLPPHTGRTLDVQRLLATPAASASPPPAIHPQQLAYLIYTSGSTGTPKGVAITHANAAAFLAWASATFTPADLHATLATTSVCFDLSIFELFAPLCGGGSVLLLPDALALPTVDAALAPTLLNTVPSVLAALLPLAPLPPSLRVIALAGEALPVPLATELLTHTSAQLYNLYGPSEDTTYSTWACFTHADALASAASVPIGQPISATQAFILDPTGQQVPVGVVGELYLGGAGLARGYLGRPALTAERFVPHPWSSTPGARLYRTGDLVRLRADGPIEYVGRRDTQIKLRGFRIELGEVQAVLEQAPGVAQAAVLVHADTPATAQLVGYVVPHSPDLSEATLRSWLEQQLPAYMVPSVLLLLPAFPRTPNGKLDRAALPAPHTMPPASTAAAPPATPTEELVAATWSSVLGQPITDRQANFFAVGGHSLLAVRVATELQTTLNINLPVGAIFKQPTIKTLAQYIDQHQHTTNNISEAIQKNATTRYIPSIGQQQLWFLDQLNPNSPHYNIPFIFDIKGTLNINILKKSIYTLLQRHESLRTRFVSHDGTSVAHIEKIERDNVVVIDISNLITQQKELALQLAFDEIKQPFSLSQAPLIRTMLIKLEKDQYVLVITLHHSVTDGWSNEIFFSELNIIYTDQLNKAAEQLAEIRYSYTDFAYWQHQQLEQDKFTEQLKYWQTKLNNYNNFLALPIDHIPSSSNTKQGALYNHVISHELSTKLKHLSKKHHVTLFTTMLTAFQILLYRYTAQSDFLVAIPVSNRTQKEFQHAIGYFVNTLLIRANITNTSFIELLEHNKSTLYEAQAHQEVPFDKVIKTISPYKATSSNSLIQVMFDLIESSSQLINFPDTIVQSIECHTGTSKFELTCEVNDQGDHVLFLIEYDTAVFNQETIVMISKQYEEMLNSVVLNPDIIIKNIVIPTRATEAYNDDPIALILQQPLIKDFAIIKEQHAAIYSIAVVVEEQHETLINTIRSMLQAYDPHATFNIFILDLLPLTPQGTINIHAIRALQGISYAHVTDAASESVPAEDPDQRRTHLSDVKQTLLEKRLKQLRGK